MAIVPRNSAAGAEEIIRERKRRILSLKTLVFFILSSFLLVFLLGRLELRKTLETLRDADPAMVIYAGLAYILANYFKSLRYEVMLKELAIPMPRMFAISGYQNFFNQILPARTGELTLVYYLKTIGGADISKGLHSLLVTRIFDFIVVAAFFMCSILVYYGRESSISLLLLGAVFLAISVIALFNLKWLVIFSAWVFESAVRILKLERSPLSLKIRSKIEPIIDEFARFDTRRYIPMLALTSILVWIALYVFSYLTILSLGIDISFLQSVAGSTGAVLTNTLPINSFGSFGTLEAGWTGGFVLVGMSEQDAITSGFAYHILNFLVSALISGVCFVALKFGRGGGKR